ncbi:MAG: hypothetical protein ABSG73_12855 [Candidatus Aminicenantales bacterium]|jgi:hypothetical protein
MVKKATAVFTLLAFMLFSVSCFKVYKVKQESVEGQPAGALAGAEITAVQTKAGKTFEFPKGHRAFIKNDLIVGEAQEISPIDPADIKTEKRDDRGKIMEVTTKDGKIHRVVNAGEGKEGMVTVGTVPVSIPLSEVELIWLRSVDQGKTFLYNGLVVGGVVLVAAIISAAVFFHALNKTLSHAESCPFIYSFDGKQYVFDAEPYGTAICQALKRTEWASLDHLRETGGHYKVRIANELDETQNTDELKLVVVDHPEGVKVVPDALGGFHTFSKLVTPDKAVDQTGRDIRPLVAANDRSFWLSQVDGKDPAKSQDLRDELTLEFPKPAGARQAKLLANAWTTHWGSAVARKFLELPGRSLPGLYAEMNRRGPFYGIYTNWARNEELFLLRIWVETRDGWKVKGVLNGGGPFISKDKAYVLDISDVEGLTLKIRLRPPVNFWMFNELAVDYSDDITVRSSEIAAAAAVDRTGRDVRAKIVADDDDYLTAPARGDWAEAVFPAPARVAGLDRSVFVKATGYYDIHLDATGEPQLAALFKLLSEPGSATRFALVEYQKRVAGLQAKEAKR